MKMVEKANISWEQDQVIRTTALYATLYDFFEKELKRIHGNRILYQFMFPKNNGHRKYNIYKRQFLVLLRTNKLNFHKNAHKLNIDLKESPVNTEGAKVIELDHGDIFYSPVEEVDDPRYSIAEIHGKGEEICLFCNIKTTDIEPHYELEASPRDTEKIEIRVVEMKTLGISEKIIYIEAKRGMLVGELKRKICEVLPVPVSRQQLVSENRILKNNEAVVSLSITLREKKK